jgi:hypothetical protein
VRPGPPQVGFDIHYAPWSSEFVWDLFVYALFVLVRPLSRASIS